VKIFLDVGAHVGETVDGALKSGIVDHTYCFEPVAACLKELEKFNVPGVTILPFGLANTTRSATVYNPGTLGASIYKDSEWTQPNALDLCPYGSTENCEFVQASEWFRNNLLADDIVIMKLNCEGAECEILEDLMDSGEIRKVHFLNISWDSEMFPGMRGRRYRVEKMLHKFWSAKSLSGPRFISSSDIYGSPYYFNPYISNHEYTVFWLKLAMLCIEGRG
jgi:FkbM family methyltransferase